MKNPSNQSTKLTIKVLLLLGLCIILNGSCNMGAIVNHFTDSSDNGNAILLMKKSFPVATIKELNVTTSGGSISVKGDADQEAVLEMYVKSRKGLSSEEIQEILDRDYDIDIEHRNGVLHAHATRKRNLSWNEALSISFIIRTGDDLKTNLSTSGGSIELANLSGKQIFKTSGGSLSIENLIGNINGKTSGGTIQAYNSQGTINLTTSGGGIRLEKLDGDVFVTTSGGGIKGKQIRGTLNAKTSGGSIDLDDLVCKVNASTSGGSVTLRVQELAGDVHLSTSAGSVNLTLPRSVSANLNLRGSKVNTSGLSDFIGSNNKGKLVGSLNGGGMNIDASTSAGSINLNLK